MSTDRSVNKLTAPADNEVRHRILDAARQQFAERGYAATTLREIAAAADVTKPMVYYYFANKEGLYRSLIEGAFNNFETKLQSAANDGDRGRADPRSKLVALARVYLEFFSENAATLRLLLRACMPSHAQGAPPFDLSKLVRFHTGVVTKILREEDSTAQLKTLSDTDIELFAAVFRSTMGGLYHETLADPERLSPADALPERVIDLLWCGITNLHSKS